MDGAQTNVPPIKGAPAGRARPNDVLSQFVPEQGGAIGSLYSPFWSHERFPCVLHKGPDLILCITSRPEAPPATPSLPLPPSISARRSEERTCRGCRPSLARMIHKRRRETAQKSEAARRALDWKAECMGSCSMPFKTSPTQQSRAFQRLQQMAHESSWLRSASGSSSLGRSDRRPSSPSPARERSARRSGRGGMTVNLRMLLRIDQGEEIEAADGAVVYAQISPTAAQTSVRS
jgi:hypothetical protein